MDRNLRDFRTFYVVSLDGEIWHTRAPNLSWSHFRSIMRRADSLASPLRFCRHIPLDLIVFKSPLNPVNPANPVILSSLPLGSDPSFSSNPP